MCAHRQIVEQGNQTEVYAFLENLQREMSPHLSGFPLQEPFFQLMCYPVSDVTHTHTQTHTHTRIHSQLGPLMAAVFLPASCDAWFARVTADHVLCLAVGCRELVCTCVCVCVCVCVYAQVPNIVKASLDALLATLAQRFPDAFGRHILVRLVQSAVIMPGMQGSQPGVPRYA